MANKKPFLTSDIWAGIYIVIVLAAVYLLTQTGCSLLNTTTPSQKLSASNLYRKDMVITVNGVTREGVITMPMLEKNTIYVKAAGNLDTFVVVNCSGEKVKPKAWNQTATTKSGLFGWSTKTIELKREVEFTYVPTGLEKLGSCALELKGYAVDGKHSWGFVDFQTDTFKLQGLMTCNGETRAFEGVEACQSREELWQVLKFDEEVFMTPDSGCEIGVQAENGALTGKEFTFQMPKGECVYRIKGKTTGKLGKLTLIGYNNILIRE